MKNIIDSLMQYFDCKNQIELAEILGKSQQSISYMRQTNLLYGKSGFPLLVEKKTCGKFPAWQTRPDIYPPEIFHQSIPSNSDNESIADAKAN